MSFTSAPGPSSPMAVPPTTIAGHAVTVDDAAGGTMNLRIGLRGQPLVGLARALLKLDGVRVTGGPEGTGGGRRYIVSCLGFKMVLSSAFEEGDGVARALVSREPQPPLAVLSELGSVLDRLMSPPVSSPPIGPGARRPGTRQREGREGAEPADEKARSSGSSLSPVSSLQRSALRPGKPLVRRTELKRKTPLARGPFRKS